MSLQEVILGNLRLNLNMLMEPGALKGLKGKEPSAKKSQIGIKPLKPRVLHIMNLPGLMICLRNDFQQIDMFGQSNCRKKDRSKECKNH